MGVVQKALRNGRLGLPVRLRKLDVQHVPSLSGTSSPGSANAIPPVTDMAAASR